LHLHPEDKTSTSTVTIVVAACCSAVVVVIIIAAVIMRRRAGSKAAFNDHSVEFSNPSFGNDPENPLTMSFDEPLDFASEA
jgi:flagellar biosynthesis/type III secretory pathway M-ring protein FliF/YscJ